MGKQEFKIKNEGDFDPEELKAEIDWDTYANMLDDLENSNLEDLDTANLKYDDAQFDQDLDILRKLDSDQQARKDSLFSKKSKRESIKRRGGVRQESPFFDDD